MRRPFFPKRYADVVQRMRVPVGFVLLAAFLWLARPTSRSLLIGMPVSALGLLLRAWAAGHLAKNERLATSGPYAYTRNPLYLGTLLAAAGFLIAARDGWLAIGFIAAFLLLYLPVIEQEQQHLVNLFPGYAGYAARTPLLLPALSRGAAQPEAFRKQLYFRNQEYKALFAALAGAGVLLLKLIYSR